MALPGQSFFVVQIPLIGGSLLVDSDPGILEHLMINNVTAATTLWAQLFDFPGPPPNGTIPVFNFPLSPLANLFWTPPTAAAAGQSVIGWKFTSGLTIAVSSTPNVLTVNAAAGIAQVWVWGRGTEL
jgi:hypothetical protein